MTSIVSPLGLSLALIRSSDGESRRAACTLSVGERQHALAPAESGTERSFLVVSTNVKLIHDFMGNVNAFLMHHSWKLSQNSTILPPILCSRDRNRAENRSDENVTGLSKPAIQKGIFREPSKPWEVERISWSTLPEEPRLSPLSSESLTQSPSQAGGVARRHLMQSTWRTLTCCYNIPRKHLSRLHFPTARELKPINTEGIPPHL